MADELMVSEPINLGPFIREWLVDGEEWYGLSPLLLAMRQFGWVLPVDGDRFAAYRQRLKEVRNGERRLPDALIERAVEIDSEQRANGYDGP